MNKKYILLAACTLVIGMFSCTDLSEEVYSDIPFDKFFKTDKEVLMNAGRAYTKLQSFPEEFSLWTLIEMASDEMVAPGRDDGFVWDDGRWDQLHSHKIKPINKILTYAWDFVQGGVSACNEVLYETETSPITFEGKDKIIAEIKVLRALYYYWALDNWGNVPFSIDFLSKADPPQKNRQFLFSFIEKEIKDNIKYLQEQPDQAYYGRVTKGMAYTLLAKMYLNSEEWLGSANWTEAIAYCDSVIDLNAYEIEEDYFTNFKASNENSKENIFVIPNHSIYTKDNFYWYTLTLNDASRATFGFIGLMWDEFILEPGFLDKYAQEDLRKKSFLFGQQYDSKGEPIYLIEGTNNDTAWFIYTPTVDNYMSRKKWEGARFCKYEYQPNLEYYVTDMQNDYVLFRFADVLYTKFEALYRDGRAAEMIGDPDLMKIRTRAGLPAYTLGDLSDTELLNEFGREFALEARRRQDQIRFGTWGNAGWNKPVSGPNAKLFPIPQAVLNGNPNLVQNPI
jgi:starch-binding outer membrane protein, SusD/RagB family